MRSPNGWQCGCLAHAAGQSGRKLLPRQAERRPPNFGDSGTQIHITNRKTSMTGRAVMQARGCTAAAAARVDARSMLRRPRVESMRRLRLSSKGADLAISAGAPHALPLGFAAFASALEDSVHIQTARRRRRSHRWVRSAAKSTCLQASSWHHISESLPSCNGATRANPVRQMPREKVHSGPTRATSRQCRSMGWSCGADMSFVLTVQPKTIGSMLANNRRQVTQEPEIPTPHSQGSLPVRAGGTAT